MITKEAYQLNQMIKDSEEYRQYLQAKAKVKENVELYQAMNAFRRRNFELQSYDDGINRYEEIHKLSLEYESKRVLQNEIDRFTQQKNALKEGMDRGTRPEHQRHIGDPGP